MVTKLTQNSAPGLQGFTVDHPLSDTEEIVSSATPKGIHMNQGNTSVENKAAAAQEKPQEAPTRKDQLAENRMQADARAAELNAQLDQPSSAEEKPKQNNIIAVLIGL